MDVTMNDILDEVKNIKEDFNKREAALAEEKRAFEQERAAHDAKNPANSGADKASSWRDFADAIAEKRAITLNGTGAIQQMNGLWKLIKQREPLLDRVSYFRGPNSQSQIAILSARPALPSKTAEGEGSITPDSTAGITSKSLYPYTWAAVLPVTYEAALYSISDIEARVPELLAEAFKTAMCNNMFTGSGANSTMKGLFAAGNVHADNLFETATNTGVGIKDVWDLALKMKDMDIANPVIVMNPAIYSSLVTAEVTGYDFLRKELTTNKTIEGIEVVITGKAPTFSGASAGDCVVWGGDLANYAIALADEVTIEPMHKVGDTKTYFQAVAAFTGDIVDNRNVYGLKKKA